MKISSEFCPRLRPRSHQVMNLGTDELGPHLRCRNQSPRGLRPQTQPDRPMGGTAMGREDHCNI